MTEHSRLAGQTLWDLIDARVAATPDAVLAVDETGRRVTFAEYAEAATIPRLLVLLTEKQA